MSDKTPAATGTAGPAGNHCSAPSTGNQDSLAEHVRALERLRYRAMLDSDVATLRELLSEQLVYTHSNGDRDTKASYLAKVADGTFTYDTIEHPEERILIADGVAVVIGMMTARARWAGKLHRISNASAAVWASEGDQWRLLAYAPTPRVHDGA